MQETGNAGTTCECGFYCWYVTPQVFIRKMVLPYFDVG